MTTMKRLCLWLVPLGMAIGAYVYGRMDQPAGPRLHAPTSVNLGRHETGKGLSTEIPLYNRGTEALQIQRIRTSCGCLALGIADAGKLIPPEGVSIPPGQTVHLVVRMTTRGRPVREEIQILRVETNDSQQPEHTIQILAEVEARIQPSPVQISVGKMLAGSKTIRHVEIRDFGRSNDVGPWKLTTARPNIICAEGVDAESAGGSTSPDRGTQYKVLRSYAVHVTAPDQPGPFEAVLEFAAEGVDPIRVPASGTVVSRFSVSPSTMVLPRFSEGGLIYTSEVSFEELNGAAVKLDIVECPAGFAAKLVGDGVANPARVVVSCSRVGVEGAKRARIIFRACAAGRSEVIELPVYRSAHGSNP